MLNKYTKTETQRSLAYCVTNSRSRGHILEILPVTTYLDIGRPYGHFKCEAGGALQVLHARINTDTLPDLTRYDEVSNRCSDSQEWSESFHSLSTRTERASNANQESFREVLRVLGTMREDRKILSLHRRCMMIKIHTVEAREVVDNAKDRELVDFGLDGKYQYGHNCSDILTVIRPTPKRQEYSPVTLIVPK